MADEIQINPATQGNGQVANAGSATNQAATTGAATTQTPGFVKADGVIDLRALDQQAAPVATAPAKKNAVMLDDEVNQQGAVVGQDKKTIPLNIAGKFPDLQQLIDETESMNASERDYWYQVLPIMTDDQIKKFRDILVNEKEQLKKLDKEYEQELVKLNEKHMIEWQDFQSKEKRKALKQAEQAAQATEQTTEEDLLRRLSQV